MFFFLFVCFCFLLSPEKGFVVCGSVFVFGTVCVLIDVCFFNLCFGDLCLKEGFVYFLLNKSQYLTSNLIYSSSFYARQILIIFLNNIFCKVKSRLHQTIFGDLCLFE